MTSEAGSAEANATAVPRALAEAAGGGRAWPAFRLVPRIDQDPRLVAFAQTIPGRLAVFAVFNVLLALSNIQITSDACYTGRAFACLGISRIEFVFAVLAAAAAYGGRFRWWIVAFAGVFFFRPAGETVPDTLLQLVVAQEGVSFANQPWLVLAFPPVAVFAFMAGFITLLRRYRSSFLFQRPFFLYLCVFTALTTIATARIITGRAELLLWLFVGLLAMNFPMIGYALADAKADRTARPLALHAAFGTMHRLWGSYGVPFGKGVGYLSRFEAKTPSELAVTQFKGLKLLLWAVELHILLSLFAFGVHDILKVPVYSVAIEQLAAGHAYPWYVCWASLVYEFLGNLLGAASAGGVVIGTARLAGFRLLRNTYRPLESRTIAEFWNRYRFYFKEMLVDLFFYPTFLTCFKKYKRLRLAFATFMAACVGNSLSHFIGSLGYEGDILRYGPAHAILGYQTYVFYAFVLAAGITISQMMPRRSQEPKGWLFDRFVPQFRVALFYCLLQIFDYNGRTVSLADHFRFFFHLFGVDTWI